METLKYIGIIHSPLKDLSDCPLQEDEGAPQVVVAINKDYLAAIFGLEAGNKIVLLTWLHKANREVLSTYPRNNITAAHRGIFATRSPDRPNPIGMHIAEILAISETGEITLSQLEVLDGTPVIDIKPHLG